LVAPYKQPLGATPVIAYDNTLGSFSQFQGRLYLAYVGVGVNAGTAGDTNSQDSDIFLISSDDSGTTWSSPTRVNDDSANDGFSQGNRQQYQPQVAVDPTTGTLVVSFLDNRHDAAGLRPVTTVTDSVDGGDTFSPQPYANNAVTAVDAIKGAGSPALQLT